MKDSTKSEDEKYAEKSKGSARPEIFDNIIEAIRHESPNHVLLNCLDRDGFAIRHQNFQPVLMPDDTVGQFSNGLSTMFYRGERREHPSCKASLYRIRSLEDRIAALIRTYDFQLFMESTHEVQEWKKQNRYLDLWSLSQHYGFATPMIDATYEIAVAAFFATHKFDWRINSYVRQDTGIGLIWCKFGIPGMDSSIRPIGMQPFDRPGKQDGVAIWPGEDRDLAEESYAVKFRQNAEINVKLDRAMLQGADVFFPFEPIAGPSLMLQNTNIVTSAAIDRYLKDGIQYISGGASDRGDVEKILRKKNIGIVDAPLVHGNFLGIMRGPVADGARALKITPAIDKYLGKRQIFVPVNSG